MAINRRYSRMQTVEQKKNKQKAYVFIFLSILSVVLLFKFGIPIFVKFSGFFYDLKSDSDPVDITDTTPPPPPRLNIHSMSTKDDSIEISGNTEEGALVTLSINRKEEEILADNEGKFSYEASLEDGENKIYAVSKDKSGNESKETDTFTITYDLVPPELEIISPSDHSEFYGSHQKQLNIEGQTEKNTKVQINDRLVIVNSDGKFFFTTNLSDGENIFNIKAEDEAGNSTEESLSVTYYP